VLEKNHDHSSLVPHLEEFVNILLKLITDINFKICINTLNSVGLLIKLADEEAISPYMESLIGVLFEKLGDSKIATRQISHQILTLTSRV
jgi:hypothetical protein